MASYGFRPRDQAAMEFIDDCIQQADQYRKPFEPQWFENWGNYRVESGFNDRIPSKQYPLAAGGFNRFEISPINFLKSTESHQGVNTLRALLLAGLYGVRDYVQADPVGGEDVEKASKVSKVVMYGCERPGNFRTNWETLGDSLTFGLGSYSARWKHIDRLVPRRIPVPDPNASGNFLRDPSTGAIMTVLQNMMAPVFDDPVLETDDLFETWFDPSANRFDQLLWKAKLFRIRDEELVSLIEDPNWDAEGIKAVLDAEPGARFSGPERADHPKLITETLTMEDIKEAKAYGYYGGWMLEGTIPKSVADEVSGQGSQEIDSRGTVVLRMIDGICVQSIQSPQRNGNIQGGSITILPTGRGIYGLSPLTVVRYLQDVSDTQLILTVQAMIESVYQNYLIAGDIGPEFAKQLEHRRPREVFTLQGEVDQVKPLEKDYNGLQIATNALTLLSQTMRNAMNARDPVQGITRQTGETTATENTNVMNAALQNTDQLAVLIERDELPTMGRLINDLYYVNLEDEAKVFRRIGESEMTSVSYFDIDAVSDITFVGARSVLSRSQKFNQFRDFATMMASNPLTAASVDWHKLALRWGDEGFQIKGLDQLMLQDEEEIVARLQAAGLANTMRPSNGGGPGQGGGAPNAKGRANPASGGRRGGLPAQTAGEAA